MDQQFNRALSQHTSPKRLNDTRTMSRSRKRKQNDVDDDSEYNPNSGRDDYQPRNKRRKVAAKRHMDTPMPQRRSMRLATKENLQLNGLDNGLGALLNYNLSRSRSPPNPPRSNKQVLRTNNDMVGDSQLEDSDDSDLSARSRKSRRNRKPASPGRSRSRRRSPSPIQSAEDYSKRNGHAHANGYANGHLAEDDDGLRRSTRIRKKHSESQSQPLRHTQESFTRMVNSNLANIEEDERGSDGEEAKKKQPGDSDYDEDEYQQELENEEEQEQDDMDEADESGYESDPQPRRRSSRLSKKDQVHYYNDGEAMMRARRNQTADKPEEMKRDKSKSLPLSLRRPKRNRQKPRKVYEESQWEEYYKSQERRESLRTRKQVNYKESHDDSSADTSAGGTTVPTSSSRSRSSRSTRSRSRSRSRSAYSRRRRARALSRRRARGYDTDSEDSESSSCSTDTFMEMRRERRLRKERKKINPIEIHDLGLYDQGMAPSMNKKKSKEGPADISPMDIDLKVDWNMVGGLQHHVQKLKEMVILPLLYPKEFEQFKMSTPKGVLFHGPPGTGKTLVARVLAAQCSVGTNPDGTPKKKVAFYMRKGADCLSKWVGEAERQLRLLFDEAHKNQPAVIFFDEIDGLAPVRSSRQDQIHSSIVSTLLALMDGLDSRGQIIVIGATNRPDAIDPALRRPGRFDRELCFNLPSKKARKDILKIHTKSWDATNCKLDDKTLTYLSEQSVGYCGADLEALCREAFLAAVRRTYPQIYHSNIRLSIDTQRLKVIRSDFEKALKDITPSSQRSSLVYARALPKLLQPLLNAQLSSIRNDIESLFSFKKAQDGDDGDNATLTHVTEEDNTETHNTETNTAEWSNDRNHNRDTNTVQKASNQHYRYLIHGKDGQNGQSHLGTAVLHLLEEYPMYSLDLASLYGDSSTKCADEAILRIFKEAQRNTPSVVYWPHVDRWWNAAHDILKTSITLLIGDIANDCSILIVATSNIPMGELDDDLAEMFNNFAFHDTDRALSVTERRAFWMQIGEIMEEKPRHKPKSIEEYPSLPIAELPPPSPGTLAVKHKKSGNDIERDEANSEKLIEQDRMACVNLRVYIRAVCNRLCKHFKNFIDQMKEGDVVVNALSLFEIRQRNNERTVPTVLAFLRDIDQLVQNVKDSAQTDSLKARQFVNEACHLQDQALSMMSQVNRDLVKQCDRMAAEQNAKGGTSSKKRRRVSFRDDDQEEMDDGSPGSTESPQSNHNERKSSLRNGARPSDKAEKDDESGSVEPMVLEEVMDRDDGEEEEEQSDGLSVTIDENKWNAMLTKLVKVTKDYNVQEMEEKMYTLLRIVYQHSNQWDKEDLMEELDEHVSNYFKEKLNA